MKKQISSEITSAGQELSQQDSNDVENNFGNLHNVHWHIIGASVPGLSHTKSEKTIPCQDSYFLKKVTDNVGVAIVCDGAGSAKNSHHGSKFAAERAAELFAGLVNEYPDWITGKLPDEKTWTEKSMLILKQLRREMEEHATKIQVDFQSIACTIIVVIYFPVGLLVTHIGDGRAGYRNTDGEWYQMLSPHKGSEANQTVFLTSEVWHQNDIVLKGIPVPECVIIRDRPQCFTLMSDGCEYHSFDLGYFEEEKELFIANNKPYHGFFEPIRETMNNMLSNKLADDEINEKWAQFLTSGIPALAQEYDDKTMVFGMLLNDNVNK